MFKKITLLSLTAAISATAVFGATIQDMQTANYLSGNAIIASGQEYQFEGPVSRKEVMDVALAIAGIAKNDICHGYFRDASTLSPETCRTVETAAAYGFINDMTERVRPTDNVTNAEAVAILMKSAPDYGAFAGYSYYWDENFPTDGDSIGYKDAYVFGAEWQARTMYDYIRKIKHDDAGLRINPMVSRDATRGQVYGFAKVMLDHKNNQ